MTSTFEIDLDLLTQSESESFGEISTVGERSRKRNRDNSYPGGKSGSGIYQRLINHIPPHDVLIVPFAGHCGVTRRIRPAKKTIVIDLDPKVCDWWYRLSRTADFLGSNIEIHHCDGIDWLRYNLGSTIYTPPSPADEIGGRARGCSKGHNVGPAPQDSMTVDRHFLQFVLCDPPYIRNLRSSVDRIYDHEMTDYQHSQLISVLSMVDREKTGVMLCGYPSPIYEALERRDWRTLDHEVPTRRGLHSERIWFSYEQPTDLHDYRFLGSDRRDRERIRRKQINLKNNLDSLPVLERNAMLEFLM